VVGSRAAGLGYIYTIMNLIEKTSWEKIFNNWYQREGKRKEWDKVAKNKGWKNWKEWRKNWVRPLNLKTRKWAIYKVTPKEVSSFLIGPTQSWQKHFPFKEQLKKSFKDLTKIRSYKNNPKVRALLKSFPSKNNFIGIVMPNKKIMLLEGHHRATALTLKPRQVKIEIALTKFTEKDTALLYKMLHLGSTKIPAINKKTTKIVAIGGGSFRSKSIIDIDKRIKELTEKSHPTILFIPTASSDDQEYIALMSQRYQKKLKCKFTTLLLIKNPPSKKEIASKIAKADIIYVGGGNTLKMMRLWRKLGVDKMLEKAWQNGKVMCGVSAGSICWFDSGHSDSMSYYNSKKWEYINVSGLDLLPAVHCPHYDSHTLKIARKKNFQDMFAKLPASTLGIAINDNTAIEFIGSQYRILGSEKTSKAFRLYKKNGEVIEEEIPATKELQPQVLLFR